MVWVCVCACYCGVTASKLHARNRFEKQMYRTSIDKINSNSTMCSIRMCVSVCVCSILLFASHTIASMAYNKRFNGIPRICKVQQYWWCWTMFGSIVVHRHTHSTTTHISDFCTMLLQFTYTQSPFAIHLIVNTRWNTHVLRTSNLLNRPFFVTVFIFCTHTSSCT